MRIRQRCRRLRYLAQALELTEPDALLTAPKVSVECLCLLPEKLRFNKPRRD
jgi:hypothetical protein